MPFTILLVDDDRAFGKRLQRFLQKEGHHAEWVQSGEQAVAQYAELAPDLLLLDLMLPGMGGLEALRQIRAQDASATALVMTAHGTIKTAVEAIHAGAADFLLKPIDLEALLAKLEWVREHSGLKADLGYMLEREQQRAGARGFVGDSPVMQAVYGRIGEVAATDDTTVLITGPSGTGKELVARAVHAQSNRSHKPLMQIDCTAIPLHLLESELFGHERGAFTGADRTRKGLLELAEGGTLFLDEVGDMAYELQGKFLRVLQERKLRRVGGTRELPVDVRVISATHQDLDAGVAERRFRSDLLFRLRVFEIRLPPLRERGDDILAIAESFLEEFATRFKRPVRALSVEAREALLAYPFPGNVRELRNIMEQAVILAKGEALTPDLLAIHRAPAMAARSLAPAPAPAPAAPSPSSPSPPSPSSPSSSSPQGASPAGAKLLSLDALGQTPLETAERELIRQALERTAGNKKRAAELLGITRFALQRRAQKLGLG
ncbi:MAG: sigma-54 dependent transcriptional regulator [Myxococcales bacterium]|nr:sigma-54 dependent transcriptional regulator [Myxococcales bacterium]